MTTFMVALMVLFFALGIPIAISVIGASLLGVSIFTNIKPIVVAQHLVTTLDNFPLLAVPFFILAGNLMEASGISHRLVDLAKSMIGNIQGGLAATCVLTCMVFASVSGSSIATAFAIGSIIIPAMVHHKYPINFAGALQATSAELGVIVPPSIPMILYGVSANVSIGDMFIAGIGPGFLIGAALTAYVLVKCRIRGWGKTDGEGRLPFFTALVRAGWGIIMPVIILGGIYMGVFTPTEASVVAVVYSVFVGFVVYRTLSIRTFNLAVRKSLLSASIIMVIIAAAGVFSYLLTRLGVPAAVGNWMAETIESPIVFLIMVNVALFIIGMFIETSSSILVLSPILAPVAIQYGIDPVHFGLIMIVNLAMGMITPPFGVNLFAVCEVAKLSIDRLIRDLGGFIVVIIICLMLITFIPGISLFLIR